MRIDKKMLNKINNLSPFSYIHVDINEYECLLDNEDIPSIIEDLIEIIEDYKYQLEDKENEIKDLEDFYINKSYIGD